MSAAFFDPTMYSSALQAAQHGATAAYQAAMRPDHAPRSFIRDAWSELVNRSHRAIASGSPDAQMAAAVQARDVMEAITRLSPQHYRALDPVESHRAAQIGGYSFDPAEAMAAAVGSNPALKRFQEERDQAHQEQAAEVQARWQAIERQQLRDAPQNLLAELRRRKIELGLTDDGEHITAPPGHSLQPSEIEVIRQRRDDFVTLLKIEAAAAAPVIIA